MCFSLFLRGGGLPSFCRGKSGIGQVFFPIISISEFFEQTLSESPFTPFFKKKKHIRDRRGSLARRGRRGEYYSLTGAIATIDTCSEFIATAILQRTVAHYRAVESCRRDCMGPFFK